MRTKKVTRHYCDHCSKGMFHKPAMADHEKRCFRNPNRVCQICACPKPPAELLSAFNEGGLPALKDAAQNCPACIVSILIQRFDGDADNWVEYDYKKEMEFWMSEKYPDYSLL